MPLPPIDSPPGTGTSRACRAFLADCSTACICCSSAFTSASEGAPAATTASPALAGDAAEAWCAVAGAGKLFASSGSATSLAAAGRAVVPVPTVGPAWIPPPVAARPPDSPPLPAPQALSARHAAAMADGTHALPKALIHSKASDRNRRGGPLPCCDARGRHRGPARPTYPPAPRHAPPGQLAAAGALRPGRGPRLHREPRRVHVVRARSQPSTTGSPPSQRGSSR